MCIQYLFISFNTEMCPIHLRTQDGEIGVKQPDGLMIRGHPVI